VSDTLTSVGEFDYYEYGHTISNVVKELKRLGSIVTSLQKSLQKKQNENHLPNKSYAQTVSPISSPNPIKCVNNGTPQVISECNDGDKTEFIDIPTEGNLVRHEPNSDPKITDDDDPQNTQGSTLTNSEHHYHVNETTTCNSDAEPTYKNENGKMTNHNLHNAGENIDKFINDATSSQVVSHNKKFK